MDQFIRSHVRALSSAAGRMPRLASCLQVEKIAERCVASHAGVAEADLLVFIDGTPAARAGRKLLEPASKRLYSFYSLERSETIELAATGIDVGIELSATSEAIAARYKPAEWNADDLQQLWLNRQHQVLLDLASATRALPGGEDTPALLFEGVGLYETGDHDEGLERIEQYLEEHAQSWTMNFAAIGMHYTGIEELRRGDRAAALRGLQAAFAYHPLERTADAIGELTGARPPIEVPRWRDRRYPADYTLPILEGGEGDVSLSRTLGSMEHGKLLVVCMLASYRSNGPYGRLLQRWINYATWFGPFLHGMHVVTSEAIRSGNHGWQYGLEDDARRCPLPFVLLYDEDNRTTDALDLESSPAVFVLTADATIVYEGELESVGFWNTLARTRH